MPVSHDTDGNPGWNPPTPMCICAHVHMRAHTHAQVYMPVQVWHTYMWRHKYMWMAGEHIRECGCQRMALGAFLDGIPCILKQSSTKPIASQKASLTGQWALGICLSLPLSSWLWVYKSWLPCVVLSGHSGSELRLCGRHCTDSAISLAPRLTFWLLH